MENSIAGGRGLCHLDSDLTDSLATDSNMVACLEEPSAEKVR